MCRPGEPPTPSKLPKVVKANCRDFALQWWLVCEMKECHVDVACFAFEPFEVVGLFGILWSM